jgi:hypothetical protein
MTELGPGRSGIRTPAGARDSSIVKNVSQDSERPTQPPIQWVAEATSLS